MTLFKKEQNEKKGFFKNAAFIFCILLSFFLLFPAGINNNNTRIEKIADYSSQVVSNFTKDKRYCCITVEATSDSGSLPSSDSEFHNLYGVFKQTNITFASSINADKKHDVRIRYASSGESENLSFFYVGPVGTSPYNGHYKHYVYPTEVMFKDVRMYDISHYVVYISKTHADIILDDNGLLRNEDGSHSEDSYRSLLKQFIPISIDGETFNFVIQNIYYESNYYYKGLHDVMGDFVIVSYYLPMNLRIEQKNMYFLTKYAYENKYFMNYINDVYSGKKFKVEINQYNILGNINVNFLLSFYYSNTTSDSLSTALICVSAAILLFAILYFLLYLNYKNKSKLHLRLSFFCIPFLPYIIFSFIARCTCDISLWSELSTKANFFMLIGYFSLLLIVKCINKKQQSRVISYLETGEIHEISI